MMLFFFFYIKVGELSCVNPPPHQVEHMALYGSLAVQGPAVDMALQLAL